jgi:excisionase family DNA binding protein
MNPQEVSPWLTPVEAASYAKVGKRAIYSHVRGGRLRAARIGGKGELRILRDWLDDFLTAAASPVPVAMSMRRRV